LRWLQREITQAADIVQLLVSGEFIEQGWFFGKVTDMFDEGETIRDGIAHHPRGTTGWFRERGQHPHHGRFAGTVRAKHTVDDTFRNGQRGGRRRRGQFRIVSSGREFRLQPL